MMKYLFQVLLLLNFSIIQGCVTTTDKVQINVEAAHGTRIELGMKYLAKGMRDNARYQFSKALKLKKNSALAYQGIAMVHQANGEFEPAEKAFRKALKYADERNRSAILVAYGKYLNQIDKGADACQLFEDAAGDFEYTARAEALYLAGKCAANAGNKVRQKAAYEHALNLNPNLPVVIIDLAEIYFADGEYTKTKVLLDRLDKLANATAQSLWLGIRIERIFGNLDKEASLALALKNRFPYSKEYLEYKRLTETKR